MSNWKDSIRQSIRTIADSDRIADKPDVYYAEVDSVDEATRTCSCTLISGTSDISLETVNLMAEINDGLLRIPTVGSTVYILSSKNVTPWVDMFSQLDKIYYIAGGNTFLITDTGIELMGKKYAGVPKVIDPDDSNAGVLKKLNNIENIVNDLISKYNSHTHTGVQTGGGTSGTTLALETNTLTPTQQTDIENPHVQHGDNS